MQLPQTSATDATGAQEGKILLDATAALSAMPAGMAGRTPPEPMMASCLTARAPPNPTMTGLPAQRDLQINRQEGQEGRGFGLSLRRLEDGVARLRAEASAAQQDRAAMSNEIAAARQEMAALSAEVAAARQERAALNAEIAAAQRDRAALSAEIAAERKERATLIAEVTSARQERAALNAEFLQIRVALTACLQPLADPAADALWAPPPLPQHVAGE